MVKKQKNQTKKLIVYINYEGNIFLTFLEVNTNKRNNALDNLQPFSIK
jgi:hypothetical protein